VVTTEMEKIKRYMHSVNYRNEVVKDLTHQAMILKLLRNYTFFQKAKNK
jgi:hypothetical protein